MDLEKRRVPGFIYTVFLFLLVVLLLMGSGCMDSGIQNPPESIKIGVLYPLSGDSAGFGRDCVNGTLLAIEEINQAGGIQALQGARLDVVMGDTRGIPDIGARETERLIRQEGVAAIIGVYASSVTIPATEVSERLKTPFMVNPGIADVITERGFRYLFRIMPKAEYYGENQVRFLQDLHNRTAIPIQRVALLHENSGFGTAAVFGQRSSLIRAGLEPVIEVAYDAALVTDMKDEISRILSADPDIILVTTYLSDSILIRKELARRGSDIPFIDTAGGTVTTRYIDELGPLAEGTLTLSEYSIHTKEGKSLNDRYYSRFTSNITGDSAYSYQAVMVLRDALERAGSADREKIRDALAATNMTQEEYMILPGEGIRFDESGQNIYSQLIMAQIQGGQLVPVWPDEYAIAPVRTPFTPSG